MALLRIISACLKLIRRLPFCLLLLSCFANAGEPMELEKSVCGIREPFVFWLWSSMAGKAKSSRIDALANVEDIAVQTVDGRTLRGYKLKAQASGGESDQAKGYLLVVQGNAVLADQILSSFTHFSSTGIDVYIFDFRGYGRSGGKRRLKAMVNDYGEIIDLLNSRAYSSKLFYGMSFGGILLLNALKERQQGDRIVIDSTPGRLSDYGCPQAYDPVSNFPEEASNFLFIAGGRDDVVTSAMSGELINMAQEHGAIVLRDPEMGHPFMDRNQVIHDRRMETVRSFLLQGEVADEK